MDYSIFQYLNNLAGQHNWIKELAIFFGQQFQYWLVGGVSFYIIARKATIKNIRRLALAFLAAIVSRFVFASAIHNLFFRPRPFANHQAYQLIPNDMLSGSFPSGHMSFLFAFGAIIYLQNKKAGWVVFAGSFLIGLARIFVGVHYPSDILGGILLGVLVGFVFGKLAQLWWARRESNPHGFTSIRF